MRSRRRVRALLRVWSDAGVTVTRHGARYEVHGIEAPRWWRSWCDRYAAELAKELPDQDRPRRRQLVVPFEDLRPAWNEISGCQRHDPHERTRQELPIDHLRALAEYAELD